MWCHYEGPDNNSSLHLFSNVYSKSVRQSQQCRALFKVQQCVLCSVIKQRDPSAFHLAANLHDWCGCCANLVRLFLSLTGCLASAVVTSWTPSLTTCCPARGGVCWDGGQRRKGVVGKCGWFPICCCLLPKVSPFCVSDSKVYFSHLCTYSEMVLRLLQVVRRPSTFLSFAVSLTSEVRG